MCQICSWRGANLFRAQLAGAFLRRAQLAGADLSGAHLEGVNLTEAYLERATLWVAQLAETFLNGAHLEGADLSQAQLARADLTGVFLDPATDVSTAVWTAPQATVGPQLADVHWGGVNLTAVDWEDIKTLGDERVAEQRRDVYQAGNPRRSVRSDSRNSRPQAGLTAYSLWRCAARDSRHPRHATTIALRSWIGKPCGTHASSAAGCSPGCWERSLGMGIAWDASSRPMGSRSASSPWRCWALPCRQGLTSRSIQPVTCSCSV
jgi:Pentapeptide repeats (8 copies)